MNREEARAWVKRIQGGSGPNPEAAEFLANGPVGGVASGLWNDTTFRYGIEYGLIIALRKAFDLTEIDLKPGAEK